MPLYEYRCTECGHHFEVVHRMSADPITECEVCGGPVERVLHAPAIHFKGSGFHNTDYGTKRRPAGGDGDGASGGDGAPGSGDSGSGGSDANSSSGDSGSGSSKTVGLDTV